MKKESDMNDVITIERFNKLTGQETLHPLVGLINLPCHELQNVLCLPSNFYAMICRQDKQELQTSLQLINPGEMFELPSVYHHGHTNCKGVLFHPDLLLETPLEECIDRYPTRCSYHSFLTEHEAQTIVDFLQDIDKELHHAIDRHSSTIIVSHIELLLNFCTRYCSKLKQDAQSV